MFAGPNGSGKSVLKSYLPPELLGVYLNADEIEAVVRHQGGLDFQSFGVETVTEEVLPFFTKARQLLDHGLAESAQQFNFSGGRLDFCGVPVNSYFAAVAVDFLRTKLLERQDSFTFETVMSSPDKMRLMEKAQSLGYRTYLYYVATEDPIINVSRVKNRVKKGGHDVPEDKIISRYGRSLDLLADTIRHTNRAYIFDNSNPEHIWLAEITNGNALEMKTDRIPAWFKHAVLDKMSGDL